MARTNKRKYTRHKRRASVRFREPGKDWKSGFTTDISVGGMFISSRSFPDADRIEVDITFSKTVSFLLKARVVRGVKVAARLQSIQQGGFGVEIVQPAPEGWYAHLLSYEQGS